MESPGIPLHVSTSLNLSQETDIHTLRKFFSSPLPSCATHVFRRMGIVDAPIAGSRVLFGSWPILCLAIQ